MSNATETASAVPAGYRPLRSTPDDLRSISKGTRSLIVSILFFNVLSAVLFMLLVSRPVYDDQFNIIDVHTYATQGVSAATIRSNRTPPGPTGFAWMAATVRLLGGEELRDARIGAFISWILLAVVILFCAPYTRFPNLWYGALLASLVFPHSVEAMALVLTEGPALFFAILGALAWIEFVSRSKVTPAILLLGIVGGLLMGLAVTARQYFLALLPAAIVVARQEAHTRSLKRDRIWCAGLVASLAAAALPVLLLVIIWKGFSSPGMATGTSYPMWKARVGFDLWRPIVAAFYAAFYLLPLTFPAMSYLKIANRWRAAMAALVAGGAAGCFNGSILQWGPLRTVVLAVGRGSAGRAVVFGLVAAATIYNTIAVALLLWEKRSTIVSCAPAVFALLAVAFFVAEQVGVGGNIPLYDRYLLQIAPFLGIIAFSVFPRLTRTQVIAVIFLSLVSHIMLWRYASTTHNSSQPETGYLQLEGVRGGVPDAWIQPTPA